MPKNEVLKSMQKLSVMVLHDLETAKEFYEAMKKESVDILYPIGDGFHVRNADAVR